MFYVYTYRDTRPNKNNAVVYVGKGSEKTNRANYHWENRHKCKNPRLRNLLNLLAKTGLEPKIDKVFNTEIETEAFAKEVELIALYGRLDLNLGTLYNNTDGGEGFMNMAPKIIHARSKKIKETHNTPEVKEKNRQSALIFWSDKEKSKKRREQIKINADRPEYRKKLSEQIKKSHERPEIREKIGEASKQHWQSDDYREKVMASHKETMSSPKEKSRKSAATKEGWNNESTRQKRIDGIKASRTPELRAQISESCKKLWDDEARQLQSDRMREACSTPEAKANRAKAAKEAWARRKAQKE